MKQKSQYCALNAFSRTHTQDLLIAIQSELNNIVIMITHDVDVAAINEIIDVQQERHVVSYFLLNILYATAHVLKS
ncbi:hypothetical protein [Colwellia sp. E2M01]|uniref:hypothetical protein n=1 Tax=Colwellia sp. E2M01 TaxID=2841561 RepID=UPI001C09293F|nr:hypothetical protein [Colwellia sp. E2M01]MBU2870168.1 hypothetical protein [Colwellia sp. E2M01]